MIGLVDGQWLNEQRVRRVARLCGLGSICILAWLLVTSRGTLDWLGRPLGTDFSNVWAAGKMALGGRAAETWDWQQHFAIQRVLHGPGLVEFYAWHYPPPFLLVAAPLAVLPYTLALIVWQAVTLAAFALMMQRLVPGRDSLLLTLAAPATLICLAHGQNGFLTGLLLGGGLLLLDRRPFAAGILVGCLIYKPQFGLVLPVMLLAGRHWKAIVGAVISAGLIVGLTLALWGWPVWQAFIESLPLTRTAIVENGAAGFYKITSPFAAARLWGVSVHTAYVVQAIVAFLVIAATIMVSRASRLPEVRNSLVCAAAALGTPYVLDYDLVILLPALAWLYLDGRRHGFMRWDGTLMACVWIAPLFARPVAQFAYVPLGVLSAIAVAAISVRRFIALQRGCDR